VPLALVTGALLALASVATAQVGTETHPASPPTPLNTIRPRTPPPAAPAWRGQRPAEPENQPSGPRFIVNHIGFVGNSILPDKELSRIAKPYEKRRVTLDNLRELCLKIRDDYKSKGYILARAGVPPQKIKNGNVYLAISEGRFGRIRIRGTDRYSPQFIRKMFSPAVDVGVVRLDAVQRALLIMSEFPELQVRSFFEIGNKPGTTDLVLKVEDDSPWHVGFDYDNFGSDLVGRNRAGLSLWGGHLLTDGDQIYIHATHPFPGDSNPYYQGSYSIPVGRYGTQLHFGYSTATTTVGQELAILDIRGDAEVANATLTHPLKRTLRKTSDLALGFVTKDVMNFVFNDVLVSNDKLRMFTLGYSANWIGDSSRTVASAVVTQGLGAAFRGTENGSVLSSRPGSDAGNDFSKINLNLAHLAKLGDRHFLLFRSATQQTIDALAVPEQFAIGGPNSVRGFIQSEFLADYGYNLSGEYRYSVVDDDPFTLQTAVFVDGGSGTIKNPLLGEVVNRDLIGAGVGLRASHSDRVSARIDVGFPIKGREIDDENHVIYGQMSSRF